MEHRSQTIWHFGANTLCRRKAYKGFASHAVTKADFVHSAGSSSLLQRERSKAVFAGWFWDVVMRLEAQMDVGLQS